MFGYEERRIAMVHDQVQSRGVRDVRVLNAMRKVPREDFLPDHLKEFAYEDRPLLIADGQVMAQPYLIAYMLEALQLAGIEKVLEIGVGTGYVSALLAELADAVHGIEVSAPVAIKAAANLSKAGYSNVHILHDDSTEGWIEEAPFNAILVSSAMAEVSEPLRQQLAVYGRLVVPIGVNEHAQEIVRVIRASGVNFEQVPLADVRFVPVLGDLGEHVEDLASLPANQPRVVRRSSETTDSVSALILQRATSFASVDEIPLDTLIKRVGDRRIVLIGEASHGTSEFYSARARITQRLIEERGFDFVAVEADWPDAACIDHHVRHRGIPAASWENLARFPTWMWRNQEVRSFVDWLHAWNGGRQYNSRAGFYGLDIYSLHHSANAVIDYLEEQDPPLASIARQRYGCLSPWQADPAAYGQATLSGAYRACEKDVTQMLVDLYSRQKDYLQNDGERFFDAEQNARLVSSAERYYRVMYYGSNASWNLRDAHMYDTLCNLLNHHGPESRAVVWAHNSHVGDASFTEMSIRGEYNLGELVRRHFREQAYLIGFGTHQGTVAAASEWGGSMQTMEVRPSHPQSHEYQFHLTNQPGLLLSLADHPDAELHSALSVPRLQRAIGVIYRPDSELFSHYYEARLASQFDEYIWIDTSSAVTPLPAVQDEAMPDTYPFGV